MTRTIWLARDGDSPSDLLWLCFTQPKLDVYEDWNTDDPNDQISVMDELPEKVRDLLGLSRITVEAGSLVEIDFHTSMDTITHSIKPREEHVP
jgi:hypothetical protein